MFHRRVHILWCRGLYFVWRILFHLPSRSYMRQKKTSTPLLRLIVVYFVGILPFISIVLSSFPLSFFYFPFPPFLSPFFIFSPAWLTTPLLIYKEKWMSLGQTKKLNDFRGDYRVKSIKLRQFNIWASASRTSFESSNHKRQMRQPLINATCNRQTPCRSTSTTPRHLTRGTVGQLTSGDEKS